MISTTTPRLIALCSPAMGSGKSTVANHLVARHGFAAVKFAGQLKRMTAALLTCCGVSQPLVERYVDGDLKEAIIGDLGPFRYSYARTMLATLDQWPEEVTLTFDQILDSLYLWGVATLKPGVTSRRIQQTLGTEWGRDQIHPELWVLLARDAWNREHAKGRSVVVDDMRFPNELAAVRAAGGTPVRITRVSASVPQPHASEGQLDECAMTAIVNSGTIELLLLQADALLLRV